MNLAALIAAMLAGLTANPYLAWIPGAVALLEKIAASLQVNASKVANTLPEGFTARQALDAVFAFLKLEFPAESALLTILQAIADSFFTMPSPVVVPTHMLTHLPPPVVPAS